MMRIKEVEELLLKKSAAYIDYPFGDIHMVLKVSNKVFAILAIEEDPLRINLKCNPDDAIAKMSRIIIEVFTVVY